MSFRIPAFYMPWQARVNPSLAVARRHTKAWAQKVGILGSEQSVWSEERYDAADYPRFTASVHPQAPPAQLGLLCDWYVWLFYLDDHFCACFKRDGHAASGKAFLSRLLAFMPIDEGAKPPEAQNIVEVGLTDLWPRTAAGATTAWRERFLASNRRLLEEFLWEIAIAGEDRIANPIEYIEMRRRTSGAPWSADLVEHSLPNEMPDGVHATRAVRVLRGVFADTVGLHNDIVSYRKEIEVEREFNNGVHIVKLFLDCSLQAAVDTVDDIMTSRLHHFEHTVLTELAPMFEERALTVPERATVMSFIRGLQDWMAGNHSWHRVSGRYASSGAVTGGAGRLPTRPRGLGTSAAARAPATRPRRPSGAREPNDPPRIHMPYRTRCNAAAESAAVSGKRWVREMGMLDGSVWSEARFDAMQLVLKPALAHPDAPGEELEIITRWQLWGHYADDFFVEAFKRRRPLGVQDLVAARLLAERLRAFMPLGNGSGGGLPATALERGLADLWAGLPAELPESARRRASDAVMGMIADGWIWELANLFHRRVPDPVDYVEMRRKSSGAAWLLGIVRWLRPAASTLPAAVLRARPMRELTDCAADWIGLHNDLVSLAREAGYEGDANTSVLSIERLLRCSRAEAKTIVTRLLNERMSQFERIAARELGPLSDEFELDPDARERLLAEAGALQSALAGHHAWSQRTGRYASGGSPAARRPLAGPLGLGRSAKRVRERTGKDGRALTRIGAERQRTGGEQ